MFNIESILQSPKDKGPLQHGEGQYKDASGNTYPITHGVADFLLEVDEFVHAEDHLGEVMDEGHPDHVMQQWNESKDHFWNQFLEQEKELKGKTVLYIGSGLDEAFMRFADQHVSLINVDVAEKLLEQLKEKGAEHCIRADISTLPFVDGSVDYIVMIDLLHHFATRSMDPTTKELVRVLKPGGKMYIQEINRFGLFRLPIAWAPLFILNRLRGLKGLYKKDYHRPESYEAPISTTTVKRSLRKAAAIEFKTISTPQYPEVNSIFLFIWKLVRHVPFVQKYCGYHWYLVATRKS